MNRASLGGGGGVWQIFWGCVFQKVQNGGFVRLGEKKLWCSKAGGACIRLTVLHEFFHVHLIILTLRLDEEQEGEFPLLLILDDLEL